MGFVAELALVLMMYHVGGLYTKQCKSEHEKYIVIAAIHVLVFWLIWPATWFIDAWYYATIVLSNTPRIVKLNADTLLFVWVCGAVSARVFGFEEWINTPGVAVVLAIELLWLTHFKVVMG